MANSFVNPQAEVIHVPSTPYCELLLGCGMDRKKVLAKVDGEKGWQNLVTLDIDPSCNPDYVWDLNNLPLPFQDEEFDEIHAYEVLEHVGNQGDYKTFFAQFTEFHRLLKPNGAFFGSVPCWDSEWAWGDPGHTRVITPGSLVFLDQNNYGKEGVPMTDYRDTYKVSFELEGVMDKKERMYFILRKK